MIVCSKGRRVEFFRVCFEYGGGGSVVGFFIIRRINVNYEL